ncbi:hypothetical protein GOBAR_AA00263 [Gossypium barbadense]|uniref:Uncharacterized protein n=1 Tax=Gossypium barbadense TaxID=3634 RepID=A0A2P5YXN6_GOSBA|nr:hypothetical protein GOBAR_AA00263 [Gossypium barbadense]
MTTDEKDNLWLSPTQRTNLQKHTSPDQWVGAFGKGSQSNAYHLEMGGCSSTFMQPQSPIIFCMFRSKPIDVTMYSTPPQATFDPTPNPPTIDLSGNISNAGGGNSHVNTSLNTGNSLSQICNVSKCLEPPAIAPPVPEINSVETWWDSQATTDALCHPKSFQVLGYSSALALRVLSSMAFLTSSKCTCPASIYFACLNPILSIRVTSP